MLNLRMEEALASGECLDVAEMGAYDGTQDVYVLRDFIDDKDYAEKSRERWVYSIGRRKSDGAILAAFDSRFYLNDDFDCLWLR